MVALLKRVFQLQSDPKRQQYFGAYSRPWHELFSNILAQLAGNLLSLFSAGSDAALTWELLSMLACLANEPQKQQLYAELHECIADALRENPWSAARALVHPLGRTLNDFASEKKK